MPIFIFCEICHRHHWSHYHQTVEILFALIDSQGDVEIMSNELTIDETADPATQAFGSCGALTDVNGVTVEDTVASASWSVDDAAVATVAPNPNSAIDSVFTILGDGVANVTVTGDTASGATVTGTGTITVSNFVSPAGPAVNVAVELSLTDPTAPVVPPAEPTTPAA